MTEDHGRTPKSSTLAILVLWILCLLPIGKGVVELFRG